MDSESRHKGRRPLLPFLGFSLLVHLQVVLIVLLAVALDPDGCRYTDDIPVEPFEVALVPSSQDELAELQRRQDELKEQEEEERDEERDAKGQVVELPPPVQEKRPDKARYLSEYDSTVERETKAPPSPQKPGPQKVQPAMRARRGQQDAAEQPQQPMKLAMRQPKLEVPESELPPAADGEEAARRQREAPGPERPQQEASEGRGLPRAADLMLSDRELAEALGGRVNDALSEVEEGETTLLNSKRWRYAGFFNRVKRQVAQNWRPDRVYRRRDPTGQVYGFKDRLTVLRVKLDPTGELQAVHVERASGLGFLDDEAINAFRLAQPFPNPPRGLVDDATGLISFRFGFLFEISRRPNLQIFRYQN